MATLTTIAAIARETGLKPTAIRMRFSRAGIRAAAILTSDKVTGLYDVSSLTTPRRKVEPARRACVVEDAQFLAAAGETLDAAAARLGYGRGEYLERVLYRAKQGAVAHALRANARRSS